MKRRDFLAVILITHLGAASFAQEPRTPITEPPPQRPPATQQQKPEDIDVVRITTNLVQVDAVVADKSGKVVTDQARKAGDRNWPEKPLLRHEISFAP